MVMRDKGKSTLRKETLRVSLLRVPPPPENFPGCRRLAR
jgi:hypothetical protein